MNHTMNYNRRRSFRPSALKIAGMVIGGIALAVLLAFVFGYFVMMLWNWLMPTLFGLAEINYWMAFGLIILARLLFGGFGSGHHKHSEKKKDHFRSYFGKGKSNRCRSSKDWNEYENFWEEEGEQAYDDYLKRKSINIQPEE